MVDSDIQTRARLLCACPLGCVFLLLAEANEVDPVALAEPMLAIQFAARALSEKRFWFSTHDWVVAAALVEGARLLPLARAVLAQPAAARWFAPVDFGAQVWLGSGSGGPPELAELPREGDRADQADRTNRERGSEIPIGSLQTSTAVDGMTSTLAALIYYAGDYHLGKPPLPRYRVRLAGEPRVYEVDGLGSWHRLCTQYPDHDEDGRLVPDWSAVAADWDGVHLSLGGLLTADEVAVEGDAGWTELRFWDYETTYWLRWRLAEVERLPDVTDLDVLQQPIRVPDTLEAPFDPNDRSRARIRLIRVPESDE